MCDFFEFYNSICYESIPSDVAEMAKNCILDCLGTAIAGSQTEMSRVTREFAVDVMGPTQKHGATFLFGNSKVSVPAAAMVNAFTIDSYDIHDGTNMSKGHVSCTVLSALLACASDLAASGAAIDGRRFITAFVVGYEAGNRFAVEMHRQCAAEYHTSGSWGSVAAAAAGAWLHRLPPHGDAMRHALGIAEYSCPHSLMMRCISHPTMLKDGAGFGAMTGVAAVYMARAGFTGAPAQIVESAAGTGSTDYTTRWTIRETYFKLYPVCRWAQPAIAAVSKIMRNNAITFKDIKSVKIRTFHDAVCLGKNIPKTTEEAQYAIGWPVACLLVRGKITTREICEEAFGIPEIRSVCANIVLEEDCECNAVYPKLLKATVEIQTNAGHYLSEDGIPEGDPSTPLTTTEISDKFLRLAGPVLGENIANLLVNDVRTIESNNEFFEILNKSLYKSPKNSSV